VDLRGELDEADAPRRPLEGVVAAVQLVERPGLVVPPAEPEHQRLDPLEEVGGVGEEDLADLGIELDEGGRHAVSYPLPPGEGARKAGEGLRTRERNGLKWRRLFTGRSLFVGRQPR
jgi:hypothetical protein